MSSENGNSSYNGGNFEAFLEGWLVRQEHYLDELLEVNRRSDQCQEEDLRELVSRIIAHYQQYYEEKSKLANVNVFLVFCPTWFSTLERAFLWISGFKPGLAIRIVKDSVQDLSEEQSRNITRLAQETKSQERSLNNELAKIHESVAAPPLLEIARRRATLAEGEMRAEDTAIETLKTALEGIVEAADMLRMSTALKLMEILNPAQNVKFLTAAAQLHLRLRNWGVERGEGGGGS
ncbi:hypothetical protein UlMin_000650 [Ulmus minor]